LIDAAKMIYTQAFFSKLGKTPIKAIIVDFQMPGKNGLEVIKDLKNYIAEV
jgi:DNA-binding response OmpR family regulator